MNIQKIKEHLNTKLIGSEIQYFEIIDSTNNYLKNQNINKNGLVVIAENQTQGRGRADRKWFSEPGKNLTFSILLTSIDENLNLTILPIISASALAIAIDDFTGVNTQTKWPNDLILNGKKLGGILIETSYSNNLKRIIIGIGINVNQQDFSYEINNIATSLSIETKKYHDRELLLSSLLNSYDRMYQKLLLNDYAQYLEEWRKRCNHFGKNIRFEHAGEIMQGIAKGLSNDGSLIVDTGHREIKLLSGEIIINERK